MSYNCITPPTFDVNNYNNWSEFLEHEGYVVIRDILNSEEKNDFFMTFKQDFNTLSPDFNFDDPNTWSIKTYPGMFGKGMCVFNGAGQSNFMWKLRLNSKIQSIYKNIYNTDELITSLDGFSFFFSKKQKTKRWHHIDQNPSNTILSYQGSYNYFKVSDDDAGFVVAPKSHIGFNPSVTHQRDWIMVDPSINWNEQVVKLKIPENCFTLWNSKLIHANAPMTKNITELNRLTCYVTFLPADLQTNGIRNNRISAYKNSKTCSHWANRCELKKYPFGFKKQHENKNLFKIQPLLEDGLIPNNRLNLL